MVGTMMWFKKEPKAVTEKPDQNGVVGKLRRKKAVLLKPTRESSERETSTESEKEKRRYSDILDMKVSLERRDESDESLYESADGHSDAISASDDALPRLGKTPTISKESLKLAVTDEEVDFITRTRKGHRKAMSLSNPLEIVKHLGDEWLESRRDFDKKKSRESLYSEEDRESIHGSNIKLDQIRKNSKKEDKSQSNSRKSSTVEAPKSRKTSKGSTVSLNFLRRKKTPSIIKPVEAVEEVVDIVDGTSIDEMLNYTKYFLEEEKRHATKYDVKPAVGTDSDDEPPTPKPPVGEHRRRLSRQTSRSKSKVRGKSQTVKVNTLKKSHSGTLKKGKKKGSKTPMAGRSRQSSIVETPPVVKKNSLAYKQNSWLFSGTRGDSRREGSADEQPPSELDVDPSDVTAKDLPEKEHTRLAAPSGRGVNRAESCRERDAPRRGKHRNASDPNRLTAHNNHDLEPGAATAPSGSSSSSSLSSRSNESNTVAAEQQATQSDWSEEDEPLAAQWADSLPPRALDSLLLSARLRKRQEVIHELITSEGSHVRWLKVLGFVFLQPLESQPSLLPPEELRALFPNLPGVRERHAKLYTDLKAARSEATNHVVQIRPIADAMLNTLGESGYAACLSKFCRGQRMALEQLRERRRKHKELHQFLAGKEQLPLCGRLQLRDLLACVWQRLTKYQLLLESILKTVCDSDPEPAEDVSRLRLALDVAKDVLHGVDTAIRTAENQHRLRTIQSKLEVRASGLEWEELRRLDLTQRALRMEGDLSIRCDSNKKVNVLALMLSDSLVLLQREGDKFVLKPISQPSQQGHLSPLIKWDKVLFRPNAAARNTFFLMNINGVQMHELSANTVAEYSTWVKNIQECPLAMTDLKPIITPSHHSTKSNDDSGINVSRNPSDASEKSEKSSSTAHDDNEGERDRASLGRSSTEREDRCERDDRAEGDDRSEREKISLEREDRVSQDKESVVAERDDRHKPRRPTVGLVSQHGCEPAPLEPSAAVRVAEPAASCLAHTAKRAYTHHERLRRLDESIARALRAKSAVVAELLGVDKDAISQVADLAVAETLGQIDISSELQAARLDRSSSMEDELPSPSPEDEGQSPPSADMHQLLLAAQAQANQLTEALTKALSVSESSAVAARVGRSGRCDSCRRRQLTRSAAVRSDATEQPDTPDQLTDLDDRPLDKSLDKDMSFDMLSELDARTEGLDEFESPASAAGLATKLVGVTSGLQSAVGRLLAALPSIEAERRAMRRELAALREANDALRARHARHPPFTDYELTEEMCFPKESVDRVIQDQPSNGG